MFYKQKVGNGHALLSSANLRIEDERKLMEMWRQEEVDEDYQAVLLHFFDAAQSPSEQHRLMEMELKHTHQRDSHFFRIHQLMQEREKTLDGLEGEVEALECFKKKRREPNLQPVCELIDHLRKLYLLIAEQIHQMFNQYGHPRNTGVGYSYLSLFEEFNQDVQFLKNSLLRYFMPFSQGFDPLFLQLSQRLRKCYAIQSLVYDRHVEQLVNLNASYLYRLLRSHQRMLQAVSLAQSRQQQPAQYFQPRPSLPNKPRNILNSITEEEPVNFSRETTEKFEQSRLLRQDTSKETNKRIFTPKKTEILSQLAPWSAPMQRKKETSEIGIQMEASISNINTNNIFVSRRDLEEKEQQMPSRSLLTKGASPEGEINVRMIKTPKRTSNSPPNHLPQIDEGKHLHFYRKIQQPNQRLTIIENESKNSHRRVHTEGSSNSNQKQAAIQNRPHESLPKLKNSRDNALSGKYQQCQCRRRYKERHCQHEQTDLSEQQLEKRRRAIIREIQMKYKALAQREIRHQLSKLGGLTYHRLRHLQQLHPSRQNRTYKLPPP